MKKLKNKMFSLLRPYIFSLDPETAHDLAIKSLKFNFIPESFFKVEGEEILQINLFGKKIKNPIGLAAGFDKSAEVYNSLFKFGFGFVEVGTITPKMQLGNTKPRVFRLEKDKAMINRLGFNNDGIQTVMSRLSKNIPTGTLGINIGPNKDTINKIDDFIICLSQIHKEADYITINISSPNTEGLRDLHEKEPLTLLLKRLTDLKKKKSIKKPLFIKLSPDIENKEISNIIELIFKYNIEGIVLSNTSDKNREDLLDVKKNEKGGLSGKPIQTISTKIIKCFYKEINKKIPIIGVGGVDSGASAFDKITSGANAIQLYTGMVYNGPGVVSEIKKDLISILKKEKIKSIGDAVGINA
jgi:dihydroorotate dehydrogenase